MPKRSQVTMVRFMRNMISFSLFVVVGGGNRIVALSAANGSWVSKVLLHARHNLIYYTLLVGIG